MNVKYAIILASGLSSTVAVMSQCCSFNEWGYRFSFTGCYDSAYGRIEGVGRL